MKFKTLIVLVLIVNAYPQSTVNLPTADPYGGYFTESIDVSLFSFDPGNPDSIYYTLDGQDPDKNTDPLYAAPITMTDDTTMLRFYAVNGTSTPSGIITEIYNKRDTLPPPTASPADSTVFSGSLDVALFHETVPGARIYYTLDGSEPDSTDLVFLTSLTITDPTRIKAVAYGPSGEADKWVRSASVEFNYIPKVAKPVATPGTGTFISELFIQLNISTLGATIYYTLDGSTPDAGSTRYTQIIRLTNSDTLKLIGTKPGWANSDTSVFTYIKANLPSTIKILDDNQADVPYFTETNTSFIISVETNEADILSTDAISISLNRNDSETVTLLQSGRNGDFFKLMQEFPLSVNTGLPSHNSGTLEAHYYDRLVVSWTNPNDDSDIPVDTMLIRPGPVQSQAYFTDESGSDNGITEYTGTEDTLYLVIKDQVWDPQKTYLVTLETNPVYGEGRTKDILILPLIEISPGVYGVIVPVQQNTSSNLADNLLQIVKGDWIQALYTDPVDLDQAGAQVFYGRGGEVSAQVYFTDAAGVKISDDEFWLSTSEFLHLTYIDDYTEVPKQTFVTVRNTPEAGGVTYDTLVVTLGIAERSDSVGTWRVSLPMDEAVLPDGSNNIVEINYVGQVTASVQSHTKEGSVAGVVQDRLIVAYAGYDGPTDMMNPFRSLKSENFTFSIAGQGIVYRLNDTQVKAVRIYNMSGNLLNSMSVKSNALIWDPNTLPGGVYLLQLHHAAGTRSVKVILF